MYGIRHIIVMDPHYKGSLVPRPSHHPVLDCFECAKLVERSRYHEVDRSSTLKGDQVYGASKVTYL